MPETGNRLGARARYLYNSDDIGVVYIMELDASYEIAGAGVGAAAPERYDPDNPPAGVTICPPPKGFTPRVVFAKASDNRTRREIKCMSNTSELYSTSRSQTITLAEESFTTTGRRGEKQSF